MDPRLTKPAFWAAHFYQLLGTRERNARDFLEPFFGVSFAEMHEFYESDVERPDGTGDLLSLDVGDAAAVALEYADCGDSGSEQRFFITTNAWDDWELLGYTRFPGSALTAPGSSSPLPGSDPHAMTNSDFTKPAIALFLPQSRALDFQVLA